MSGSPSVRGPGPGARVALTLIRGYQRNLSRLKSAPTCRFTPSCSEYAVQAIERFGVIRGGWLAAWRITRCNPLVAGGYDPVPQQFPRSHPTASTQTPPPEKTNP